MRDLKRLTNIFQSGKPEGCTELPEYLDVPTYMEQMSMLQEQIKQKTEVSARATSAVLTAKAWTEAVADGLPTIYEKCVKECRSHGFNCAQLYDQWCSEGRPPLEDL